MGSTESFIGFDVLYKSRSYAVDTDSDIWNFAVEISQLRSLGLADNDLRWLVRKGYVDHAREVTVAGHDGREFQSLGDMTFCDQTCFVLSEIGASIGQSVADEETSATGANLTKEVNSKAIECRCKPRWDADARLLRLDGKTVRQYKRRASNQELILSAFQEEGWPARIDDPLPPHPDQDTKRRLNDTIKCLNRKQENQLIHFRGDGTGEGVVWGLRN